MLRNDYLYRACVVLIFCICTTNLKAEPLKTWGYITSWMPDSWRTLPLGDFERLIFFELAVNEHGDIRERNGWPEQWVDLRLATQASATPLDLTVRCFDESVFNTLFTTPSAIQHFLEETLLLASDANVSGIHLDFEIYRSAQPEAVRQYRLFVQNLAAHLHQQSPVRQLSIFFPMGGDLVLYDALTLTEVNKVILQGYDAHWLNSPTAGPVAPLRGSDSNTWEKVLAQALELGLSRQSLLLSFPLYGYEWPVKSRKPRAKTTGEGVATYFSSGSNGGKVVSIQDRVRQYGAVYDAESCSSYYQFKQSDGRLVEGWFEDWWGLKCKRDFLVSEGLHGIAFFSLGYDQGELVEQFLRVR